MLLAESMNVLQFLDVEKVQACEAVCDHDNEDEKTGEENIKVKEIDKNSHHHIFNLSPFDFVKQVMHGRYSARYTSGFTSKLDKPPDYRQHTL